MRCSVFTLASLLVAFFPAVASAGGNESAVAPLVRPAIPPDADAKGRVDMSQKGQKHHSFGLKAQGIDGVDLQAFLEDAVESGVFASIGLMSAEGSGDSSLEFDANNGGLPLEVTSLDDLVGRKVELRSGVTVYLRGVVPDFAEKGKGSGGWDKGKRALTRHTVAAPDEDAKGTLEIRRKASQNRDRLVVSAQRVPSVLTFSLFMEDALDSGTFVDVGAMDQDPDDANSVRIKIDTWSGAPLPPDATSVVDLQGFDVEIRGSDGFVYVHGEVPPFSGKKKQVKGKGSLAGIGGSGKIETRSHVEAPDERITIDVKAETSAGLDLFIEDPVSSVMTLVSPMEIKGNGYRFKVSTKSGAPLPFDLGTIAQLAGLAVELREIGTGTVLLSGTVPDP